MLPYVLVFPLLASVWALPLGQPAFAQVEFPPITSTLPSDIPGGAQDADLQKAAIFAWQEFVALNWPAKISADQMGIRDTPDNNAMFGDPNYDTTEKPLVWETYRARVEIYPVSEPNGYNVNDPSYGYDSPPLYKYATTPPISNCEGQTEITRPAWVNLDETDQITLDGMFAGVLSDSPSETNQDPQLIRFAAKANRVEYVYSTMNFYWNHKGNYDEASGHLKTALNADPPTYPATPFIKFPDGTLEIKAAWRPLGENDKPDRFHTTTVRYYEKAGSAPYFCYREAKWALIALHIIHKTPTAPYFIYATFEQADNIQTQGGTSVEDENGKIIQPPPLPVPSTPELTYMDDPTEPTVTTSGPYCATPGSRLFYVNDEDNAANTPTDGNICVNRRFHDIPKTIIDVNAAAHLAIKNYNSQAVWQYYKLVNVQWKPFNKPDNNAANEVKATYYLANIVVETDYGLQHFFGNRKNGAPTDYSGPPNTTGIPNYQNVFTFEDGNVQSWQMGGCMGCHGVAQRKLGSDFSFILGKGPFASPEFGVIRPK